MHHVKTLTARGTSLHRPERAQVVRDAAARVASGDSLYRVADPPQGWHQAVLPLRGQTERVGMPGVSIVCEALETFVTV